MNGTKRCFKCETVKPRSEFYRHPEMADGLLGKCKACTRKDVAANYRVRRQYYAEYEHQRNQSAGRRATRRRQRLLRELRWPGKTRAKNATSNAIRDKRLIRQPCEVCGATKSEAHHDDYRRPLAVRWLCRVHHLAHHGKVAY